MLLLLEDGDCPPDLRTKDGATALHLACERSQKLVVKLLLKYGACPDAQDKVE